MFGVQKLKDEIEGLQEERNYFRSKFLEQVSEIASLKEALKQSEKEVSRLRRELMEGSGHFAMMTPESKRRSITSPSLHHKKSSPTSNADDEEKKQEDEEECLQGIENVMSSLSVDESSDEEDEDEQKAIRQKAEQLVRWAAYRQEVLSPDRSVATALDEAPTKD